MLHGHFPPAHKQLNHLPYHTHHPTTLTYSPIGMRASKLVRVDVLLNAQQVDALSALIHFYEIHRPRTLNIMQ